MAKFVDELNREVNASAFGAMIHRKRRNTKPEVQLNQIHYSKRNE